jgi:thiosulfate/3-mercaptopyruvate sulfurtransferase
MQAVVYDRNGANYCGRLWWMLKWAGHDAVAVLDGGLQAWQAAGGEVRAGDGAVALPVQLRAGRTLRRLVTMNEVARRLGKPDRPWSMRACRSVFAARWNRWTRSPATSPALNRPFAQNLGPDGRSRRRSSCARSSSNCWPGAIPPAWCTTAAAAVSAVPNLLAMELAGFAPTALYAGSWSEWSRHPKLPVEKG